MNAKNISVKIIGLLAALLFFLVSAGTSLAGDIEKLIEKVSKTGNVPVIVGLELPAQQRASAAH